jgi:XRE family transcriptional regulator, regulator of sulfur utilization
LPVSESQVLRSLAATIMALRRERQWSQERLAERAAIQRSYIADLERGERNPSVRTLVKLANAFDIGVAVLFQREGKSNVGQR